MNTVCRHHDSPQMRSHRAQLVLRPNHLDLANLRFLPLALDRTFRLCTIKQAHQQLLRTPIMRLHQEARLFIKALDPKPYRLSVLWLLPENLLHLDTRLVIKTLDPKLHRRSVRWLFPQNMLRLETRLVFKALDPKPYRRSVRWLFPQNMLRLETRLVLKALDPTAYLRSVR